MLNPTLTGLLSAHKPGKGSAHSLVSLSGSAEGEGEETYCRANETCSSVALLLREKNVLFWNCAPYMFDVLMTSVLLFITIFLAD